MKSDSPLTALAGEELSGEVLVTDRRGVTRTFPSVIEADEVWGTAVSRLRYKRGAFFEVKAPAPKVPEAPKVSEGSTPSRKKRGKKSRSRRSSSEDTRSEADEA